MAKPTTKPGEPLAYYRWYWRDWRGSRAVQRMSYVERGLYRELLDEQWKEGAIPADLAELADICGCPVEVMTDAWRTLSKCFRPLANSDGSLLVNERLEAERTEQDRRRINNANAGRLGANAKRTLANAEHSPYSSSRAEQSSSSASAPNALALMASVHAVCPFCGGESGAHTPTCKPTRISPAEAVS